MARKERSDKKTIKDIEKFNPDWKRDILEAAKEGATHGEFMAITGMCRKLYYRFLEDEEEFIETIDQAMVISQAWWEKWARKEGLKGGNATSMIFNLSNRFRKDWRQKQEVGFTDNEGKDANPVTIMLAKQENTYHIEDNGEIKEVTIRAEIEDNTK